jgi:hypothetical protein
MSAPTLGKIRKQNGVAGQVSCSVPVTYPGEDTKTVTFVGSAYGGPVVMVTPGGRQTFVRNADRHGTFGEAWVRSFFADRG